MSLHRLSQRFAGLDNHPRQSFYHHAHQSAYDKHQSEEIARGYVPRKLDYSSREIEH